MADNAPEELNIEQTADAIAEDLHLVEPAEKEPAPAEPAAKEPAPAAPAAPADKAPTPGAAAPKPEPAPLAPAAAPQSPGPSAAPDTWRKEAQEAWATLPPHVQEEVRKREGDIARYVGETKNAVAISKAFEAVVEPYVPFFQQNGIDPWKYTQALFSTHMSLLYGTPEQKQAALSTLAAQGGFRIPYANQTPLPYDPAAQRVNALEAEVNRMRQGVTNVTSAVQEARLAELTQAVVAFAQDTEKHPFFDEVAEDINRLIATGAAPTLEDAYLIAVNANPVTRQKLVDAAIDKRSKNLSDLEKARAAKAMKAAQANVQSTLQSGRAPELPGSIDDTLRTTLAEINARS